MKDMFEEARLAQQRADIDAVMAVDRSLAETESIRTFRLSAPVVISRPEGLYEVSRVRVTESWTATPEDDEDPLFIHVEGYFQPLTAKGTVRKNAVAIWQGLPTPLASALSA